MLQTALDLRGLGLDVHVVADACSSRSMADRMFAFDVRASRSSGSIYMFYPCCPPTSTAPTPMLPVWCPHMPPMFTLFCLSCSACTPGESCCSPHGSSTTRTAAIMPWLQSLTDLHPPHHLLCFHHETQRRPTFCIVNSECGSLASSSPRQRR